MSKQNFIPQTTNDRYAEVSRLDALDAPADLVDAFVDIEDATGQLEADMMEQKQRNLASAARRLEELNDPEIRAVVAANEVADRNRRGLFNPPVQIPTRR